MFINKNISLSTPCTQTSTHALSDTYKWPCSKCCSSHVVQETPQIQSFCLEMITLMHHMTWSWWLFLSTDNNQLLSTHLLSNAIYRTQVYIALN